jgi:Rrf2 family protein
MKFSRESYYGLLALTHLADQPPGTILQAAEIAECVDLPRMFLAKIVHKLGQHGILRSHRGTERGYALARPPKAITVREIVEVFDGPAVFSRCIFWSNACSDRDPCQLHGMWSAIRPKIAAMMDKTTLEQLAAGGQPRGVHSVIGPRSSWHKHAKKAAR